MEYQATTDAAALPQGYIQTSCICVWERESVFCVCPCRVFMCICIIWAYLCVCMSDCVCLWDILLVCEMKKKTLKKQSRGGWNKRMKSLIILETLREGGGGREGKKSNEACICTEEFSVQYRLLFMIVKRKTHQATVLRVRLEH